MQADDQHRSKHKKQTNIVFLIGLALLCVLILCHFRPHSPQTPFPPLSAITAYACDDNKRCNDKVLLLNGEILNNSADLVKEIKSLAKTWGTDTVCLNSPGGNTQSAAEISRYLSMQKMNTCVGKIFANGEKIIIAENAICNSACTWILLAGQIRIAYSENAYVGYHSSSRNIYPCGCSISIGEAPSNKLEIESLIKELAVNRGSSAEEIALQIQLLDRSFKTPSNDIDVVTVRDLVNKYQVIQKVVSN